MDHVICEVWDFFSFWSCCFCPALWDWINSKTQRRWRMLKKQHKIKVEAQPLTKITKKCQSCCMSSDVMSRAESLGCPRHQSALYQCRTKTRNKIVSTSNFAVHVPLALQTNCKSFKRAILRSSLAQHRQGARVKHKEGFACISWFSDRLQPSETLEPCRKTCH